MLEAAFPDLQGPIVYVASPAIPSLRPASFAEPSSEGFGMGQHAQAGLPAGRERSFPSLAAAADNCAMSRIWAGAHFRAADDEAARLAGLIVRQAVAAVPPRQAVASAALAP